MPRVSSTTSTKKAAAKKRTTAKKSVAAKKSAAAAAPKQQTTAIRNPYTKAQLLTALTDNTGLAKKDVVTVMDELGNIIARHLKKRGAGQFTLPGLLKVRTLKKKATKARKGRNPRTGEEMMFAAKPARTVVRVTALKNLKLMVE